MGIKRYNGWTFKKYAELLIEYRNIIENNELRIPMIILGRDQTEAHKVEWLTKKYISELTNSG